MASPNIRVFEVDAGAEAGEALAGLRRAEGFSGRAEARMASKMRAIIREALEAVVLESDFPIRTGRSQSIALNGIRVFGSSFSSLRGHIIAPAHILRLEEGGTIEPRNATYLAIPFGNAVRPDGTPKLPGPRSWGNIQKTFVYTSKRTGGKYIAYRDGDTLQCIYVLVDMVQIQGKHFMKKEWEWQREWVIQQFGEIMLDEISQIDLGKLARVTHKGGPK